MSSPTPSPASAACPRCHRPVPAAAPLGACPHCLLAAGLPSAFGPAAAEGPPPPAPSELAPEFPALEIVELLGRGGMGAVYKARQRDLDRFVALKILRPGLDADPGFAERFTREARALAQLNHPGIVTLFEFGRTPAGRYFILMEFVDGMNLRGLLDAGRLAPREALAIVPPLCDALQYAHDRGLVHRDIKPENILVDRLGRVKIADFGIARLAADPAGASTSGPAGSEGLTEIGKAIGTPAYMAPEQRQDPAAVDHRADLYALGVVLYQMLTGELPAPGQLQPPSRRVQIDVRLDEIVLRALEKDPALRYSAASEFKTHLETVTTTPHLAPAASPSASSPAAAPARPHYGFSYRSRRTLFGLPLLHVATGLDPATGRRQVARGIVAIGDIAQGFIALGGVAMGGFTFGGISLGVFSYGGLVLALFAVGGLGIGGIAAFAGLAIAPVALGGFALGGYAFGGSALGAHVSAPGHHDPAAVAFFGSWAREFTQAAGIATLAAMGFGFALMFYAIEWARKRSVTAAEPSASATPSPAPNAHGSFSPWIVFLVLFAAYLDWLILSGAQLPERVASHFNAHGQADGWMSRIDYLFSAALVPFGLAAFIALVGWSLRWLPAHLINLPRRDYWLAPERKAETAAVLFRWMAGPACLLLVLFAEIHLALVHANQLATPRLSVGFLLGPLIGFLIALMLWIVGFVLRFAEPDASAAKTRRQTWALLAVGLLILGLCGAPLLSFATLKPDAAAAAAAQSAWNLDVIVTDHRAWPPQTLPADRALPVAGAALALLGSCDNRDSATAENWRAAESAPHLRLEYPRAAEGKMPDAVIIPLPFTGNSSLWTRKREAITRHNRFIPQKLAELAQALGPLGQPLARYRFSEAKEITLPHAKPLAYDFEQHRFVEYAPSAESPHGIAASPHWHLKQGTDVFSDPGSPIPTVIFLGATVTELFSSAWDQSADLVASSLRLESKSPMTSVATPYPSQAPVTRLYRTLQNGLVLVQLLGSTDTKDTSLRYKFIVPATDAPAGPTAHAPDGSELIRHNVESTVTDQRSWPPRVFPPDCALPVIEATRALLDSATGPVSATEDDWRAAQALPHLRLDKNPRTSGDLPDTVVIPLPLVTAKTVWARSEWSSDRNEIKRYYALSPSKAIALERSLAPFLETKPQFRFGPEKEVTLPYNKSLAYDFDQKRFIEHRPEFKPKEQPPKGVLPSTQWLFEQGGDAYASADSPAGISLLGTYLRQGNHGLATSMTTVESEVWDKTADEIAFYSNATWEGHLATFYASPGYRLYSTKEGGLVLVHVLGEVDGGIKLRYKAIVPAEPANPAAPAPLPNP